VGALVTWCRQVRSLDAMGRADHESTFQHALAVATSRPGSDGRAQATWNSLDLVESALRTGRREVAAAHVEAVQRDPLTLLSPRVAAVLPACRAMTSTGDHAAGFFYDALSAPSLAGFPFEHARIRLLHGEWLRRARARREARAELALAVDLFTALGARPWIQRAESEHAATGLPSPRERPGRPDGLTAQQRHVAHLAASGLTNGEIAARMSVSRRTVATHLAGAFRTLDVHTRAALRDALDSLPTTPVPPGAAGRDSR
jgi:DNA-binding CsgD family transcriptional regulator